MKKGLIILGTVFVVAGIALIIGALIAAGFNLSKLDIAKFETNTYDISDDFYSIDIKINEADVIFRRADDGKCSVICYENEKVKHSVTVEDGTLVISANDKRELFDRFGFSFKTPEITVYLPEGEYNSLTLRGSTGDISLTDEFTFNSVDMNTGTGDISLSALTCTGEIKTEVSTGNIRISDTVCASFNSDGSTGNVVLKNLVASGDMTIDRSTGDIKFDKCDAANINIKTSTGDVEGSLLTDKIFKTKTSTGDVNVPSDKSGGICRIETSTGDITVSVKR